MRFHRRLAARPMSGRKTAGTVAVVVGLSLGLTPNAAADEYTDTDTEFIGGVSRGLNNVVVDKQMIDQLIADGHKVCDLMNGGQYNVITPYIQNKYKTDSAYPMYFFAWEAAQAYCPWHTKGLAEGGI